MFYKVLQYSIPERSTKFDNILLEKSSIFKKVPDNSFSFYIVPFIELNNTLI